VYKTVVRDLEMQRPAQERWTEETGANWGCASRCSFQGVLHDVLIVMEDCSLSASLVLPCVIVVDITLILLLFLPMFWVRGM